MTLESGGVLAFLFEDCEGLFFGLELVRVGGVAGACVEGAADDDEEEEEDVPVVTDDSESDESELDEDGVGGFFFGALGGVFLAGLGWGRLGGGSSESDITDTS